MAKILRFVDVPAGAVLTDAARHELGSFDEQNRNEQYKLRQIRCGLDEPTNGVRYTAMLLVPGGQKIGPIDIPFRFNVELPVNISFTSDAANSVNQKIVMTAHDLPDSPDLYGATYLTEVLNERAAPGFPIPKWVHAVTVYDNATAAFFDANGVQICSVITAAPQLIARPRLAEFINISGAESSTRVLFHY
jgi:hypothetical protein